MSAQRREEYALRIDPVACDAFGFCAEMFPERITLDEWGYPMVDPEPVSGQLVALARKAVSECPRRAIVLERKPRPV